MKNASKNINSIDDLVNYIHKIEGELDLNNFKIHNVYIWQYLRFRIFIVLATKLGIYTQIHSKNITKKNILKASFSLLFYSLFSNPLLGRRKYETLIFNSGRKKLFRGKYIDINTDPFIEHFQLDNYLIIDAMSDFRHQQGLSQRYKHQDIQQISSFLKSKLIKFRISKNEQAFIDTIQNRISNDLNVTIGLQDFISKNLPVFIFDFKFYLKLLRRRKPQQILLICSYDYKMALIAAAKELGIKTIEIQHGTITKHNIGYTYPKGTQPAYFPDKFYMFGDFWIKNSNFPVDEKQLQITGFPYFNLLREQYATVERKMNQILVISQGSVGARMVNMIYEHIETFHDFELVYKLHPGEYDRWKKEYPKLIELSNRKNFRVIDNDTTNLYQFFSESAFVIGVYSTAVFESIAMGCNAFILDLPGIEYMQPLIDSNDVTVVKNFTNLAANLTYKKQTAVAESLFAQNVSEV